LSDDDVGRGRGRQGENKKCYKILVRKTEAWGPVYIRVHFVPQTQDGINVTERRVHVTIVTVEK
jgi:hypothetical protein